MDAEGNVISIDFILFLLCEALRSNLVKHRLLQTNTPSQRRSHFEIPDNFLKNRNFRNGAVLALSVISTLAYYLIRSFPALFYLLSSRFYRTV